MVSIPNTPYVDVSLHKPKAELQSINGSDSVKVHKDVQGVMV